MKIFKSTDQLSRALILLTVVLFGLSLAVKGLRMSCFLKQVFFWYR